MSAPRLVSLTFDGTSLGHLEVAAPLLEQHGMRGTFYADPATLLTHVEGWRAVAGRGHEIGNGCLVGAAQPDGSLPQWPLQTVADEIDISDALLSDLFPTVEHRSFGYPWGNPVCGTGEDYRFAVKAHYAVARSGTEGRNLPVKTDPLYIRTILAEGHSGEDLIRLAKPAIEGKEWVVFAFRGIGEGEAAVDLSAFQMLLDELGGAEVLPLIEAVDRWQDAWRDSVTPNPAALRRAPR
ncbi:MAG: polysaccharide deacetylase family protein [Fimbriimonadaceae bacterium]|nr:polysaccharide deacetylase family protein [Fimbriimonadaceae bacterium]